MKTLNIGKRIWNIVGDVLRVDHAREKDPSQILVCAETWKSSWIGYPAVEGATDSGLRTKGTLQPFLGRSLKPKAQCLRCS